MNHFLNFFSLFSNLNGPNNFPGPHPPGLQHMSHVPMAPTLSLGVPFSEIESILDRGRGGLTIPHSIRNHFLDQQPGFMFPFQPVPSIPLQNHQQQGMSPGVPVTEIINILNRMRANPNQPRFESETRDDQSSNQIHNHLSSKNPPIPQEHIHSQRKSKQVNDHSEHAHSHIQTESQDTQAREIDSRIASQALSTHSKGAFNEKHTHHRSDSKSMTSKHVDHLNSKGDNSDHNHLAKSKASLIESILKDTEDKDQEKTTTLDHGSKALIKRFKDPIGFHQILNDMDVQISSLKKSIGNYLTNVTNSSTQVELDSSEQIDSLDSETLQNASVECGKACPTPVECSFGFLQGVCPRCECAPDPCADNTCSANQQCIRLPDEECSDKNSSLCPQIYICEEIGCGCPSTWEPVCGTDKDAFVRTYINNCTLNCHKVEKVYDGECWSSEVPVFYFSFNDTDDDDVNERKNKTRVADELDPDDIVFEIVNETDVKRPVPVQSLDIPLSDGDNTTTLETTDVTPAKSNEETTTQPLSTTKVPIEATKIATTAAITTISTSSSLDPDMKQNTLYSAGRDHKEDTKDVDADLPKKGLYRHKISSNTPKPTKIETTAYLESGHASTMHGKKKTSVKKVKTDNSFNGRLGLLENAIPTIPKELLYDRQVPGFTSKPRSSTKHTHSGNQSKNVKSNHDLTSKKDSKHSGNGETNTKVKNDDDLRLESDDDFTGQDLPKLFQILNEYNKPWTLR